MNSLAEFTGSTMDSREIAGLTGRRHDSVIRTINKMLEALDQPVEMWAATYIGDDGSTRPCFQLPKRECLILAAGFNIKLRAAIIDRWSELESGKAKPIGVNPLSDVDNVLDYEINRRLRLINIVFGEVSNGVKVATAIESQKVVAQRTGIELALPEYITQYQVETNQVTFDEKTDTSFASKVAIGRSYVTVGEIAKNFKPLNSTEINSILVNMGYMKKIGYNTYTPTSKCDGFAGTRPLISGPNKGKLNVIGWTIDDKRFWEPVNEMLVAQRDIKQKQLDNRK